ncbi:hypothetical protein FVEG_13881 [Fusarium verticillioides 7600]|uniref:Cellobiose dehydrogenase-like cytochrome domain-containing protein n=1 Tax=Gibberella moniliformis (strain M3125 / FGSC 7600) TaxID=334819 RepID=A0A139YBG3_GIBM7|nr:hypothetical protein FVEG_13881 [Fusarium verticillioides 7600]KYG13604.1 hypothetical protein FVEG_13881 [Fusarium verticillioides 7600]RBQ87305.1 hypothetical protein FVER53263_13881 [Fusarium verticillioides]
MKQLTSIAIAATLAIFAGCSSASPTSYCNGKPDKICYTWAVPASTALSSSSTLFIRIQAPVEYQWVGLGTGDKMSGSTMFVIYQDGTGNVTLSTRMGHGHEMPEHSRMRSVRLIEGSGVVNKTMVANIHCGDLGNMHFKGSNNWISAWKIGSSLHTADIDADIEEHYGHNSFSVEFSEAVVNSNSNPFIDMTTAIPSGATSGGGGEGTTSAILGIIMSVVFLLGYPLGSLLMPIIGKWFIHATWQMIIFIATWAGFVTGKLTADRTGNWFNAPHVIIGTVVCTLMFIQPILGGLHHRSFAKHQRRTGISHAHIWYGRVLMILGIVNGGLGLQLAGASKKLIIGYDMVGSVTPLMYTAGAVRKMLRGAKKQQHEPLKYNGSYSAVALI